MTVIRFPPYVDLREGRPPMARFLNWWQRLFGKSRNNVVEFKRVA